MVKDNQVSRIENAQQQEKLALFKEYIKREGANREAPANWGEFSMLDDLENWKTAFPLAGFPPALEPPTEEDYKLAKSFCPKLYADPDLIEAERDFLRENLSHEEIAEALFLFHIGRFPEDFPHGASRAAAELRLLAPTISGVLKTRIAETEQIIRQEFKSISLRRLKDYVDRSFEKILPPGSPTCVIKYRITRPSQDSNVCCIQYFTYWPIQLRFWPPRRPLRWGLRHPFDYEPCFIFVRRYGKIHKPLMMVFNANAFITRSHIRFLKRFGHMIRTYINWDAAGMNINPYQFNIMAESMTKAYGGQYLYQTLKGWGESHINRFIRPKQSSPLKIANRWHAYDSCTKKDKEKLVLLNCELHPLKSQDLLHIEWDIRNPFQAPFLYPTASRKKDPLLHLPFDLQTILDFESFTRWNAYAYKKPALKQYWLASISQDYQDGILAGLLFEVFQNKPTPWEIWQPRIAVKVFYTKHVGAALSEIWDKFVYAYQTELEDATRKKPDDPVVWRIRGLCGMATLRKLGKKKNADEVISNFDKAIELDPECAESYYYRAFLFHAIGKKTKALQDYSTAIKLDPFERQAFLERARLLLELERHSQALEDFNRLIELDPSQQAGYIGLAEVYRAKKISKKQ